jgi:hypothetical protein
VVSAAMRPTRQLESDRLKESGEGTSPQDASGSPAVGRVALPDAQVATDPVADRAVGLEPELLVPRSWLTTLRGDVDACASAGNGLAAVHSFDPIHHAGDIFGDRQIAAP